MSIFNLETTEYENQVFTVKAFNPTVLQSTKSTSKDLDAFEKKACALYESITKKDGKQRKPSKERAAAIAFVLLHLMDFIKQHKRTVTETILRRNEATKKWEIARKENPTLNKLPSFWFPPDDSINSNGKLKRDGYEAFNVSGLSIYYSFHNGEDGEKYFYRSTQFSGNLLRKVVRSLGEAGILPSREGIKDVNDDSTFRPCILIFNYHHHHQEFDGFYRANRTLIDRLLNNIELSKPQIRRKVESLLSLRENKTIVDVKKSRKHRDYERTVHYLRNLIEMYESIKVSLKDPKEADEETLEACIKEIEIKNLKRKKEKKELNSFNLDAFSREVNARNKWLVQNEIYPRRIFHLVGNKWLWGRIYGNKGVNELPREIQKLVLIDGKETCQIDMSSACPQLFFTLNVDSSKFKKPIDFYTFKSLEQLPYFQTKNEEGETVFDKEGTREKIKFLFQVALNCDDEINAFRAYGKEYGFKGFKLDSFKTIIELMEEELPWLKEYFFKPNLGKCIIKEESDFFIEAGTKLMKEEIKFLHHFDSIFVLKEHKDKAMEILKEVGMTMFHSELNFKIK